MLINTFHILYTFFIISTFSLSIQKTLINTFTLVLVLQAGLRTRFGQWWDNIPFLTSAVVIICSIIYLVCLLVGYDSFVEICFSPSAIISQFQGKNSNAFLLENINGTIFLSNYLIILHIRILLLLA